MTLSSRARILLADFNECSTFDDPIRQLIDGAMNTGLLLQRAFPCNHDLLALFRKPCHDLLITPDIGREFRHPEFGAHSERRRKSTAFVPVPEASIQEDCYPGLWLDHIRVGKLEVLSKEAQKGLISEIEVLKLLISELGPKSALSAWMGPSGAPKDVELKADFIEVNATAMRIC